MTALLVVVLLAVGALLGSAVTWMLAGRLQLRTNRVLDAAAAARVAFRPAPALRRPPLTGGRR